MGQASSNYYSANSYENYNDPAPQDREGAEPETLPEVEEPPVMVQKVNILTLPTKELRLRLDDFKHMTKHDIRNAASKLQSAEEDEVNEQEWYQNQNYSIQIDTQNGRVQHEKGEDKNIKSHMDVALKILKISPDIKALRFKLVPAKLSEFKFWSAVFHILETYCPDDLGASETLFAALKTNKNKNAVQKQKVEAATKVTPMSDSVNKMVESDDQTSGLTSSKFNGSTNNTDLQAIIKQKDEELSSLRLQLTKMKSDLLYLQEQQRQTQSELHHPGKWILSPESKEFFSLDEDIKKKLRAGKQKRLDEVLEQMKFILDSDDVIDSNGQWNCCGQSLYDSAGCKQK